MYYRKRLIFFSERIYFLLKNVGFLSFVPIVLVNIIIPFLTCVSYYTYGFSDEFYKQISELTQIFIPFSSIWCPALILKEFTDSKGNEILLIGTKKKSSFITLIMFLLFCCNVIIVYIFFYIVFSVPFIELVKILLVSIFYMGTVVLFAHITQNTSATILLLVLYTLSNFIFYKFQGVFPFYYNNIETTETFIFKNSLPLALIGVLEFTIGTCSKIKLRNN